MLKLLEDENDAKSLERAQWLIAHVDKTFPALFDEADARLLSLLPVESVLFFVGRDDLFAKYYKSIVAAQGVHMMFRFAGECAAKNDVVQFGTMIRLVGLGSYEK